MLKKIGKIAGAVFLVFTLAVLAYMFTPFLALLLVSMESLTIILVQGLIMLIVLTLMKLVLQVLLAKQITNPFKKILQRIKKPQLKKAS
mgnify:CR=1 FL=1